MKLRTKTTVILLTLLAVSMVAPMTVMAIKPEPKTMGKGWSPYVWIEVDWDGSSQYGDWHVYADQLYVETYGGEIGDHITGGDGILEMNYEFVFKGNTLQFDETYVEGVIAYPQTQHVVLHDDGTGTYTGYDVARYDFPSEEGVWIRMDVLEYEVVVENSQVISFHYVEHEYKKYIAEE